MVILQWIIFGLAVGIVGILLMRARDPGESVITVLIGIAGALVGGMLGRLMGLYQEGDPIGFLVAVLGSIALLACYRMTAGGPRL